MTLTAADVTVGDRRLHVRRGGPGDGDVVVLVHGLLIGGRYLERLAERLSARFRVVVPDLPGAGASPGPVAFLDEQVAVLAGLLDACAVDSAWLVANSAGCHVATAVAARHPDRVRGIVLIGPAPDPASVPRQLWRMLITGLFEPIALAVWFIAGVLRAGPITAWRAAREATRHPLDAIAARVHVPALVVRGRFDLLAQPAWARAIAATFPRGRYVELDGAAHASHYDAADETARLIERFVAAT